MRLKTALIVGVVVIASAVGLSALYIRSQVKGTLKDATAALSMFADVTYGKVRVSPGGTVRVANIDIRPRAINDYLTIDEIKIETPGLWFWLTIEKKFRNGSMPENLRLSLNGVTFKLDGAMAYSVDKFIATAVAARGTPPMSNCGDISYFDFKGYRKLGYTQLVLDIALGYDVRKRDRKMEVVSEWRMRDIGAATVKLDFSGISPDMREMMVKQPRMRNFTVTYDDLSFVDRVKKFCSQATGVTVDQYVEAEVNRSDAVYRAQWGFVPGPGIRQAYREFLIKPGTVKIMGSPPEGIDMEALRLFKADDAIAMLGLQISVNDKPVTDLSVTEGAATDTTVSASVAPAVSVVEPSPAASPPAPAAVAQPVVPAPEVRAATGPLQIPLKELHRHVGREVRLTLARGTVREGALVQIRDGFARIERRMAGGSTMIAIPLGEIVSAEEGKAP